MILLNIFLFIVISVYESLADSLLPDWEIGDPSGSDSTKIFILNPCCEDKHDKIIVPAGYKYTRGLGIHKMHYVNKTWNDARNICIREGANLVVINSAGEDKLVREAGKYAKAEQVYLGMHDQFVEKDWVTVFDQPLKGRFTNWCFDNPNNGGTGPAYEDCATYWITYNGWNDNNCHSELPFMCEIKLTKLGYLP